MRRTSARRGPVDGYRVGLRRTVPGLGGLYINARRSAWPTQPPIFDTFDHYGILTITPAGDPPVAGATIGIDGLAVPMPVGNHAALGIARKLLYSEAAKEAGDGGTIKVDLDGSALLETKGNAGQSPNAPEPVLHLRFDEDTAHFVVPEPAGAAVLLTGLIPLLR